MDKNFIGERISELRLKKNVSEYQMSLDLGKNKSYIQSLTSGRSLPTMQSFLDICDYLEVTPQQFFDSELHNLPLICIYRRLSGEILYSGSQTWG